MTIARRIRIFSWIIRDLIVRYKRSLLIGFVVGLFSTLVIGRLAPLFYRTLLKPVERIGIVGDYTVSKLPKPVLQDLSFGLTTVDDAGKPQPGAAESWQVLDAGKTFVFTLRSLTWHSGKSFTARDVNYNIQGVTFTATADRTLTVTLPEAFSPFPTLVSKPLVSVGMIGLGPYRVKNVRLKGDKLDTLRLSPVANYLLPEKEYHFYQTENVAMLAYKRGDVDTLDDITEPHEFSTWVQTTVTSHIDPTRYLALFINLKLKDSQLPDRVFRQALAYATPDFTQEDETFSPIPKTSWAYNDQVRKFPYDEAQAKKQLKNAKFATDSGEFTITTFPQHADIAKRIADSWTSAGIPTKIRVVNFFDRSFQIFLKLQDVPTDPDQYTLWHSQQTETNITGYVNLKVDKLLEDGRREIDTDKRKKIYVDFQRYLVEDVPAIFLYSPKSYTIERKK
jgi:peptide/nickel transport system substrate-binding protein